MIDHSRHYIHEKKKERRPSIVSRNFRKMFGKWIVYPTVQLPTNWEKSEVTKEKNISERYFLRRKYLNLQKWSVSHTMSDKNILKKTGLKRDIWCQKSQRGEEIVSQSLTILIFKGREEIEYQLKHFWLILIPVKTLLI